MFASQYDAETRTNLFHTTEAGKSFAAVQGGETATGGNQVGLYFQFRDSETNAPVELEEFTVSFFDFDQLWADGDKGYIRESIIVADFTTMFIRSSAQIERFFSNNTKVKFDTVTSIDSVTSEPESYGLVEKDAVILRSTTHGSGGASAVKPEWEQCQGACTQTPICSVSILESSSTGCGFSDAPAGTADTSGATYYDSSGSAVNCALDCPRTGVSYDDGNPTDVTSLTTQQLDRSVSFVFRGRSNFSLYLRNEVGNDVANNTNNDLFDKDGNGPDVLSVDFNEGIPRGWVYGRRTHAPMPTSLHC